jgi:hypothetical protein
MADRTWVRKFLAGATAGIAQAGKAVVLGTGKVIDEINITLLKIGGTAVTATAAEMNILDGVTATAAELNEADAAVVGAQRKFRKAAITKAADTTAHDTAIVVPAGSVILGVYLDIQTPEATGGTKTVDIGISGGDEDGFLKDVSVAAAGTVKGTLVSTGQTLGALLSVSEDGSGALVPEPYVCSAATTICYTLGSSDFAELVANIIVEYIDIA